MLTLSSWTLGSMEEDGEHFRSHDLFVNTPFLSIIQLKNQLLSMLKPVDDCQLFKHKVKTTKYLTPKAAEKRGRFNQDANKHRWWVEKLILWVNVRDLTAGLDSWCFCWQPELEKFKDWGNNYYLTPTGEDTLQTHPQQQKQLCGMQSCTIHPFTFHQHMMLTSPKFNHYSKLISHLLIFVHYIKKCTWYGILSPNIIEYNRTFYCFYPTLHCC